MRYLIALLSLAFLSAPTLMSAGSPPMITIEDEGLEGKPAPSIELKTLDGKSVSLEQLKGKVVVLSFWASWCGPCKREMPELEKVHQDFKDMGVQVLGVNVDRESQSATAWLSHLDSPLTFPIALDSDAELLGLYGVQSMPTSFVIDRKGVVRKKTIGYRPEYIEEMRKLLKTL